MAQAVDTRGLDQLMSAWDRLLQRFPQEKQLLLRQVGGTILEQVRLRIGGTGKVAGWQEPHMGSKGGVCGRPACIRCVSDDTKRHPLPGRLYHQRH